jgi:hypothetical protein
MVRKSHPARLTISPTWTRTHETESVSFALAPSSLLNCEHTHVSERSAHDDRLVAVLLVVVVNLLNTLNSRIVRSVIVALRLVLLVPVENPSDERRDQGDTGLGAGDRLTKAEQEREVAVDVVVALEFARGLDSFPGRGNLDEDALFGDAEGLVQGDEGLGLPLSIVGELEKREGGGTRTLALVPSLSNERAASTSVETRPGTMARISLPNSTSCRGTRGSVTQSWELRDAATTPPRHE